MTARRSEHLFPYEWNLADGFPAKGIQPNGRTVFGTFTCGGGSAMGYKLAGYHYLGGVELDAAVGEVYKRNLHPEYFYNEDIRAFNRRDDLPPELYQLDILDGSPPCTLFTINRGQKREASWGKAMVFREGQAMQTLDDLPFVWCDTVSKLQPKVALMENVEGMIKGNAWRYLYTVCDKLDKSGYRPQAFLLDASVMGVPQARRRVFVIASRKDLELPLLELHFSEPRITFGEVMDRDYDGHEYDIGGVTLERWRRRKPSDFKMSHVAKRSEGKGTNFSTRILHADQVAPTLVTLRDVLFDYPRHTTDKEIRRIGSWPMDYDHTGSNLVYLTGMSVPPVMTAQIAHKIDEQWFSKLV